MLWHTGLGLLGTVVASIITRLEIIDTVIVAIAAVEATAIRRGISHDLLIDGHVTILTAITRNYCLSIAILIRCPVTLNRTSVWHVADARSLTLIGSLTNSSTDCGSTRHTNDCTQIRATGPS